MTYTVAWCTVYNQRMRTWTEYKLIISLYYRTTYLCGIINVNNHELTGKTFWKQRKLNKLIFIWNPGDFTSGIYSIYLLYVITEQEPPPPTNSYFHIIISSSIVKVITLL